MVRVDLAGSDTASVACGLTVRSLRSPVIRLCRKLVAAGHDPAEPAEAYRGSTLCLHIRSIGEAAELMIKEGDQTPRFYKFRPFPDKVFSFDEDADVNGVDADAREPATR
jgi:hypothetical protein